LTSSGQFSRGGGRTETIEIRPLRPNQATILPGVGVKGKGVKLEVSFESTAKNQFFQVKMGQEKQIVNQTMKIKSTNISAFFPFGKRNLDTQLNLNHKKSLLPFRILSYLSSGAIQIIRDSF
jgi:hypothetical protein